MTFSRHEWYHLLPSKPTDDCNLRVTRPGSFRLESSGQIFGANPLGLPKVLAPIHRLQFFVNFLHRSGRRDDRGGEVEVEGGEDREKRGRGRSGDDVQEGEEVDDDEVTL